MQALLAALLLAAAPPADAPAAGLYDIDQMEMGGGLELHADGRFRYELDYGAVSEAAEGDWTVEDGVVRLTSNPMPKAPTYELISDEPAPKGELSAKLAEPGFGGWTGRLALLATSADSNFIAVQADEDGRLPIRSAATVQPIVPVYGDPGPVIRLSPDRGHRLLFRFVPNDLGKARFNGEKLAREGETLVLRRYQAKIVFKPVQRAPSK